MIKVNENYERLEDSYLFSEIRRRIEQFKKENPDKELIRMDIGDVTLPLPKSCIEAMHQGVDQLSESDTFKGYGPEAGYEFLRNSISENDYKKHGINISPDEIFISDGAKSDLGNIGELFGKNITIAMTDPGYPVYRDAAIMDGHKIEYMPLKATNNFRPEFPSKEADVIILCSPNNPTGMAYSKDELQKWVDYAKENDRIIIFDSAYERFINQPGIPHSIYECNGAEQVAIEVRSFSKTAGFTGIRCGYTVIPKTLKGVWPGGKEEGLHALWSRRQSTKFNGASYLSQLAANAIYSEGGAAEVAEHIKYYLRNARLITETLRRKGLVCHGGENAPYIWCKIPEGFTSQSFFDYMLGTYGVSCTPGNGFGEYGEGYVRLTSFNTYENTLEAMKRIEKK